MNELTKEQVDAIRSTAKLKNHADRWIAVRFKPDNESTLEVCHEVKLPEGADQSSVTVRFTMPLTVRVENYDAAYTSEHGLTSAVAVSRGWYSEASVLVALGNLLRVDDVLKARFVLANNNETLKNAGLSHDSCYLDVYRKGRLMATMLVDDVVAPNGSFARMGNR